MFEITFNTERSVPCIAPQGRIDTVNSTTFEQAVLPFTQKESFLIFDLSKCSYLSSTGIRVLLSTAKKLKAKGGELYIASIIPEVYQVLEMAGLHQIFCFSDSFQAAAETIDLIKNKACNCFEMTLGEHRFMFHKNEQEKELALLWKDDGIVGYNELNFSVGTGIAADSLDELVNTEGFFMTTGNSAAFIPNDETLSPDFRIAHNPAQAGILVKQALSFGKTPAGWFRIYKPSATSLSQLAEFIYQNRKQISTAAKSVFAMVTVNFDQSALGISFCIIFDQQLIDQLKQNGVVGFPGLTSPSEKGISLWGAKYNCEELAKPSDNPSLESVLKEVLNLENILNVTPIEASEQLSNPLTWLFVADSFENASTHRIKLEIPDEGFSEPYKAFLTRRLYADSVRVIIKPLHGGFSAQTFQVSSFDKDGRKLRPTVLKIANRAIITREAERCQKYSLPYILNNSAMVLGTEYFGDFGALCYNFVGIGGEQTQLKWLTNYFDEWPVEKLEPIFDKTFLQILNPWYGQPVKKAIFPFRDHDPTLTFFPTLCDTAESVLDISSDEPFFNVEELGRKLVNPYWFLKHEYPRRRNSAVDYLTAICHGDLNMQNILLDQTMNVYLIDFSETRPRSVISDFARLEAIFMVERSPINSNEEMKSIIEFVSRFYGIDTLSQLPENSYSGSGADTVNKNVALTLKMREYAIKSCCGDFKLVPYYMAMLEWVLPIVCYYSTSLAHKRLSMIVAGLLCEKVAELMPE